MFPWITVLVPWLVMPCPPPNAAKGADAPREGTCAEATLRREWVEVAVVVGEEESQAVRRTARERRPTPVLRIFVVVFIG
jgi:hypothetical protein